MVPTPVDGSRMRFVSAQSIINQYNLSLVKICSESG